MTRALDHSALALSSPAETLPLALIAAARAHRDRPAMRHKRAGIWHTWSFADYLAHVAGIARHLEGAGLAPGGVLVTVGENRPEFYASHLAAQALGAAALPIGPEFLRRFGAPGERPALVLCENEDAARTWRAASGDPAATLLKLDELSLSPEAERDDEAERLAYRALRVSSQEVALILHTDGRDGAPRPIALSHARLLEAGRATVTSLALKPSDSAMAFLPMSGIGDAAVSLVQCLLSGLAVHCVEGPATFPADLKEVAPSYLPAPSRVFEILDRTTSRRLSAGGRLVRTLSGAAEKERPGARLLFSAPLLNSLGLSRCRIAIATAGEVEPGAVARLRAYGLPLRTDHALTAAGALLPGSSEGETGVEDWLCEHVEALLRGQPEIDRALVIRSGEGLSARLSLDDAVLSTFLQEQGITAAEGAAPADLPAVRDLIARRVAAVNERLAADLTARGHKIDGFQIVAEGFSPAELTLEGEVRRVPPGAATGAGPLVHRAQEAQPHQKRPRTFGAALMEVRSVHVAFGGVKALTDVSLDVRTGEILSIIGPNGAGKTSLLNVINGVYQPRAGSITFEGKTRARMRPAFAARSGIGRTFQHVSLFKGMSVLDNVMAGRAARFRTSLLAKALRLAAAVTEESREREAVERILAFLELEHLRKASVATLPYGVQKRVELARALATEPRLLLLDEPMAGMTQEEKREMCGFIRAVNESFGTTILIIEHDIGVVMGLSDRVAVLNYGRKIADGAPDEVRAHPEVIAAYLGSAAMGCKAARGGQP